MVSVGVRADTRRLFQGGPHLAPMRVFITGGASGLGRALAERYAREGARVCIADVHEKRMEETLAALGPNAHAIRCDVTKDEDLPRAAAWCEANWGGVDLVYNNAGVAAGGPIDEGTMDDWRWITEINLLGVVRGCRAFVPILKRQKSGHIVNTASMAGLINPPTMSMYNVTKAGVIALSETLRYELAPHHIDVSVVCPAFFRTNLLDNFRGTNEDVNRTTRRLVGKAKLSAEEIAGIVHRGVERREFLILTHPDGKQAWYAKRFLPSKMFTRIVVKKARRVLSKRRE